MSDELLRNPTHNGHLFVGALKRHKNRPVLFLGDHILTGGEVLDGMSRYIDAFAAHGVTTGTPVGILALNRPEVLFTIGAGQTRAAAHRPAPDRLAGRPRVRAFGRRCHDAHPGPGPAVRRAGAGSAGQGGLLKKILTMGPVPEALKDVAVDMSAEAADTPRAMSWPTCRPTTSAV